MKDTSKIVVVKRYTDPNVAFIDATLLRDNGIECCVTGSEVETLLPFLRSNVTLTVSPEDALAAAALIPDNDIDGEKE